MLSSPRKGGGIMDTEKLTEVALQATKEIVPEVYKDGLQSAVKELGKDLHTVSKLVTMALTPISAMVWSYEKIKEHFIPLLEEKLKKTPVENIITPDPSIAVPIIEALRYTGHKEELREMFSNLLATSMDKTIAPTAHPSFVEILKQINSDEAKILNLLHNYTTYPIIKVKSIDKDNVKYNELLTDFSLLPFLSGCDFPYFGPSYLVNINRLGLGIIDYTTYKPVPGSYDPLYNHPEVKKLERSILDNGQRMEIVQGTFRLTDYGKLFYDACIFNK